MAGPYIDLAVPAADGNGAGSTIPYPWGTIDCYGTFDSGTVSIQMSPDAGTTWYALKDPLWAALTFTADGYANFERATEIQLRAVLSGSSGSTSVTCRVRSGYAPTRAREY